MDLGMVTEAEKLKEKIARIERELQHAKRELSAVELADRGETSPRTFAELRGIWKGANFSYDEIEAAKYTLDDPDHFE